MHGDDSGLEVQRQIHDAHGGVVRADHRNRAGLLRLGHHRRCLVGISLVVELDDANLATHDAALGIGLGDGELDATQHVLAVVCLGAGQGSLDADDDVGRGRLRGGRQGDAGEHECSADGDAGECGGAHDDPSVVDVGSSLPYRSTPGLRSPRWSLKGH